MTFRDYLTCCLVSFILGTAMMMQHRSPADLAGTVLTVVAFYYAIRALIVELAEAREKRNR